MKFHNGNIKGIPYWGLFENENVLQHIISNLGVRDSTATPHLNTSDYVIAFIDNNKLCISRHNYYALLVGETVLHIKSCSVCIPIPDCSVLVLSRDYVDDIAKFKNPTQFCKLMSKIPEQYCIPLDRALKPRNVMDTVLLFRDDLNKYPNSALYSLQRHFNLPDVGREDLLWMLAIQQAYT